MKRAPLVALPMVLAAAPALAADTWTTPHTGVRQLARSTNRPWRIDALVVDLCAAGVSMRATAEGEHWRTVSSFADRVNAEAAVNGDFFSYDTHLPTGLAIGNGASWHADMRGSGEILFGDDRAFLNPPAANGAAPAWARNAVGGRPLLVDGGDVEAEFNRADCADRHPRTAVGISEDRRTLYLAVVDGRSNASVGMNCRELGGLMRELGAWRAMNLDGGGSSTMWIAGDGVVNDPSDGSQRTVSNHLGVQANGSGAAGNCAFDVAEVLEQAHLMDQPGNSDIDGDGRADVCARAGNGIHCATATGAGFEGDVRMPRLSDERGFDAASHYATIRMGDIDGDGRADLCARDADGFGCYPSTIAGFAARLPGPELTDAQGWGAQKFYSTLRLADVTGDGRADLCARTATDFRCWPSTGVAFGEAVIGPSLSDESGWGGIDNYGTIRMGDLDGDGRADVCARANGGMRCWRAIDGGFEAEAIAGPAWSDEAGFADVSFWSTIRLVDLDGDLRADLCARTADGLRCHLSQGDAFAAEAIAGPAFVDGSGWGDHDNYGTIRFGDVNGDRRADVCARANARVYCWLFDGTGFPTRLDGPELSDDSGWGHHVYNTSIRVADVTGDGLADVCARGSAGVDCWASDGGAFPTRLEGPRWTDANGWAAQRHFTTLRIGDAPATPERCNGRDDNRDGVVDEGCAGPDAGVVPGTDAAGDAAVGPLADVVSAGDGGAQVVDSTTHSGADARPGADFRMPGGPEAGFDSGSAVEAGLRDETGVGPGAGDPGAVEGVKQSGGCSQRPGGAAFPWLLVPALVAGVRRRRKC